MATRLGRVGSGTLAPTVRDSDGCDRQKFPASSLRKTCSGVDLWSLECCVSGSKVKAVCVNRAISLRPSDLNRYPLAPFELPALRSAGEKWIYFLSLRACGAN